MPPQIIRRDYGPEQHDMLRRATVLDAFALDGTGVPAEAMPGVAIIAKDTWSAFQAKEKLKIDWDFSAASKDSTSQFSAQAKQIAQNFPDKRDMDVGDVDLAHGLSGAECLQAWSLLLLQFEELDELSRLDRSTTRCGGSTSRSRPTPIAAATSRYGSI